jgi:RNA polymerase sigma factor (sigma-70 family)
MKKEGRWKSGLGLPPEARLFEQVQGGCQDSLDLLMARHEGLVRYAVNRQNLGDLADEEAVQAGRIGLWRAIEGFDPQRGHQFSTYAYPAIVHQIWTAVKEHCQANQRAHATREWRVFFRHWAMGPQQLQREQELQACLLAMVARLPRRLRRVIEVRYELGGQTWQTLAEMGKGMGLSGERVRQLQEEALVWLRHPAHSQELRALLRRQGGRHA